MVIGRTTYSRVSKEKRNSDRLVIKGKIMRGRVADLSREVHMKYVGRTPSSRKPGEHFLLEGGGEGSLTN